MKVKILEIRKLLQSILVKKGMSAGDARIVASEHLEGELQGKISHGLNAFLSFAKVKKFKFKKPRVLKETSSVVFVDANSNPGAVVGIRYVQRVLKMARRQGVGMLLIRNMKSWLRPETVARHVAEKGYIGLVVNDGGHPAMSAPGGYEPLLGTNPIGISIPTSGDPFVSDMALSKRAWGEIKVAKLQKRKLPKETYLDKRGDFTTDPFKVFSVVPFGSYKGFALGVLVEILGGSLVGMDMGKSKTGPTPRKRGALVLVINPQTFTNLKKFKKANSKLARDIRGSKRRKGVKTIMAPGDRAAAKRKANLERGYLDIEQDLWARLQSMV